MNDWLVAEAQTRALAHRYALALDRRDVETISNLFASDAVFGRFGHGPDGARAFYSEIWQRFGRSIHTVGTQVIDFHGPTMASGIVYCRAEQESLQTGTFETLQFAYHDDYVLEAEHWRFAGRAVRMWYRESDGVRTLAEGPSALPGSWETWGQFWEQVPDPTP
jgi:SnoaL-like domain